MTLVHARSLMERAILARSATLAFNLVSLEMAEAIIQGAERAGTGVILQISENAIRFHGGRATALLCACRELAEQSTVPIAIHLDHVQDQQIAREAIASAARTGLTSIMIDAAHLPYGENLVLTSSLTEEAHVAGLWVEAELGAVGGKDGAHVSGVRTDPEEARAFVEFTRVDALAIAVGSSHAMTSRDAKLDNALIAQIRRGVAAPLVLHGSSGVSEEGVRQAIDAGIRKVNIGTALAVAFTAELRSFFEADATTSDPRRYLALARDRVSAQVAQFCTLTTNGRPSTHTP